MKLDTSSWKEFLLSDYFDIVAGKYHYPDEYDIGNTPYVSASNENNGIAQKIDLVSDFKGNCIITGKVGCTAFYQPNDFCATSDVNVFYPKFEMNEKIGLFIATIINFNENYKWGYGRQCRVGDSKEIIVKFPADEDGNPDWAFMEKYIKSLNNKPLTTSNKGGYGSLTLGTETWKEYKISELFEIYTGGDLILSENDEGEIPVASNSSDNNNIAFYSCLIPQRKLFDHTCSISIADRGAFKAFVQPKDFYIGTRAKGLESKNKDISILSLLFIATVINQQSFRFSYGYNCCAHLNDMIIKLPVKADDSLDYSFMENYIKSLPYGDRI